MEKKNGIKVLRKFLKLNDVFKCQECGFNQENEEKALEIILNLIENQQHELQLKDKVKGE